jgi:hypothetical protein
MEAQTAADALREQLKGLLSELDEDIRISFPASHPDLARRTDIAEVSVVLDLVSLVRRALLGDALAADPRCTCSGQAADLRDSLAVCARDIRLERGRQEAELESLRVLSWPQQLAAAFQQLLDAEERVCDHLGAQAAYARERAAALKAVISDASDVCLCALSAAARLPNASEAERRRIAAEAYAKAAAAAATWLKWLASSMERQRRHWQACPPVQIPQVLSMASAQDKQTGAFLAAGRTAMKLRRQQLRLLAVQQRLAAVLAGYDVVSSLQRSIELPG